MMSLPTVQGIQNGNLIIGVGSKVARGTGTTADVSFYVAQMPVGTDKVRAYMHGDVGTLLDIANLNDESYAVTFTLPAGTHNPYFHAVNAEDKIIGTSYFEVIA